MCIVCLERSALSELYSQSVVDLARSTSLYTPVVTLAGVWTLRATARSINHIKQVYAANQTPEPHSLHSCTLYRGRCGGHLGFFRVAGRVPCTPCAPATAKAWESYTHPGA